MFLNFWVCKIAQTMCGSNKQCHVTMFVSVWHVKLVFNHILPPTIIMRAISAAQQCSVVSLLNEGYSHHQIQARISLWKVTVGRIEKEVENNKENNTAGHPSKLFTRDKTAIIQEIHSGRVDNSVQAAQFINSTISQSVTPQIVWNVLKQSSFYSARKKKVLCWRRHTEREG